jgi:hypothetical protein
METGISPHRGPVMAEGNPEGGSTPGTLKDEWKALETGHLSPRGIHEGASLLGAPKDMLSKAVEMGVCFHRGPVLGNMRWGGAFEKG